VQEVQYGEGDTAENQRLSELKDSVPHLRKEVAVPLCLQEPSHGTQMIKSQLKSVSSAKFKKLKAAKVKMKGKRISTNPHQ